MWLSDIMPLFWCVCVCRPSCRWFVAGFGYLTAQGRCCRNLQLTLLCSFVVGEAIAKIIPLCPQLVTLQDSKVRHPTPLFPYHVRISHNLARRLPFEEIRLEICRSLHICNRIYFELSTFFDSRRMYRWS